MPTAAGRVEPDGTPHAVPTPLARYRAGAYRREGEALRAVERAARHSGVVRTSGGNGGAVDDSGGMGLFEGRAAGTVAGGQGEHRVPSVRVGRGFTAG